MVQIKFFGAWEDADRQAVREVTAAGIEKNLKISVSPAFFEEEYAAAEEKNPNFSENCEWNEKSAPAVQNEPNEKFAAQVGSAAKTGCEPLVVARGELREKLASAVKITISLFPAGNGRTRRQAAQEIRANIARRTGVSKENISVAFDAPPQERRSYAEAR